MAIIIKGKIYRELRNDEDRIMVNGVIIRWSKRQQRYTLYDQKTRTQFYDTQDYEGAIRSALMR